MKFRVVFVAAAAALVVACVPPAPPAPPAPTLPSLPTPTLPPAPILPPPRPPSPTTTVAPVPTTPPRCATTSAVATEVAAAEMPALTPSEATAEATEVAATSAEGVVLVVLDGDRPEFTVTPRDAAVVEARQAAVAGDLVAVGPLSRVSIDDPGGSGEVRHGALPSAADPRRGDQWAFDQLGFETVEGCASGAATIAVIDSGVDAAHPDLAGRVSAGVSILGAGSVTVGAGGVDRNGHGTHVAGVAAATAGNGIGVRGVAPSASVLPVRVLDDDGVGWDVDTASGIVWAVDAGADVINLSLAIDVSSPQLAAAVDYAERAGVVVVAAAGNSGPSGLVPYPAAYPTVVAVAASSPSSLIAAFSTWGPHVDVAAPGVDIVSTYPGGYAYLSGTSMASPHVAGLAALVAASDPGYTPAQLRARLAATATDAGVPGRDDAFGAGIIDPEALFGR